VVSTNFLLVAFGRERREKARERLVLRSKRMIRGRSAQYRLPGRSHADELNHLTGSEH